MGTYPTKERNREIVELHAAGATQVALAERFKISRGRVCQIIAGADWRRERDEARERRREDRRRAERLERMRIEGAVILLPMLRVPLDDCELSVRAMNCLKNGGYQSLADVAREADRELLALPNLGPVTLREVRAYILDKIRRAE